MALKGKITGEAVLNNGILHERSRNLVEGIAPLDHLYAGQKVIHRRRNDRVRELEPTIEHELSPD